MLFLFFGVAAPWNAFSRYFRSNNKYTSNYFFFFLNNANPITDVPTYYRVFQGYGINNIEDSNSAF